MPNWKKIIVSGSNAELNSLNVTSTLTASGLIYPTSDNGEESFMQTDGNGNLSLQYVKTIYEEIVNGEATQLVKGTPVYVSGSIGAASIVFRADAADPSKMPVVYISADTLGSGENGRGIALGLIAGVDTTGFPAGTEIYAAVGGGFTSTRPTGSAIVQVLGYVTKEGAGGQGVVLNPGPNSLPNLTSGSVWVGNEDSLPVSVLTSSLSVATASFAVSASYAPDTTFPYTGSAQITGSLGVTGSVEIYKSGSTVFKIEGSQGELFSITDNLSGSLFSANDISGIPIFEVFSDNTVKIGTFNDEAIIVTGNTASITGSLFGTSSWAENSISSSYALTSSYADFSATTLADGGDGSIQFSLKGKLGSNADNLFWDNSNSRLGINTNIPSFPLHVLGESGNTSIFAEYDIVAFSDKSVKTNIRQIPNVIERIENSRGILYDRIDNLSKDNIGFIAQELEETFPELVTTNPDGTKAVKYQNAVAVLFEAIKQQQIQINQLIEKLK